MRFEFVRAGKHGMNVKKTCGALGGLATLSWTNFRELGPLF